MSRRVWRAFVNFLGAFVFLQEEKFRAKMWHYIVIVNILSLKSTSSDSSESIFYNVISPRNTFIDCSISFAHCTIKRTIQKTKNQLFPVFFTYRLQTHINQQQKKGSKPEFLTKFSIQYTFFSTLFLKFPLYLNFPQFLFYFYYLIAKLIMNIFKIIHIFEWRLLLEIINV